MILIAILVLPLVGCIVALDGGPPTGPTDPVIVHPRPADGWPDDTPHVTGGGQFYFAGQPGEEGLRHAASIGITIVVNLRPEDEMAEVYFEEKALVKKLGMKYASLPVTPATFSIEDVERFAEIADRYKLILVHDDTSDRAGAMWAALLYGWTWTEPHMCLESGRRAGLQSGEMLEAVRRLFPGRAVTDLEDQSGT